MNASSSATRTKTSIHDSYYYYGTSSDSYYSASKKYSRHYTRHSHNYQDKRQIKKLKEKRNQLESKIYALKQRISSLQKQKKKQIKTQLTDNQLERLKRVSLLQETEHRHPQMQDLIKSYFLITREVSNLRAKCDVLESQVNAEHDNRDKILNETLVIDNALRFSDYCPLINVNLIQSFDRVSNDDRYLYQKQLDHLSSLNRQINDIDCHRIPQNIQPQAALEFARASYAEVKLKSYGKDGLMFEIDDLNDLLQFTSDEVKETENEKERLRQKLNKLEIESEDEVFQADLRKTNFDESCQQKLNIIESNIANIKYMIEKSAKDFETIQSEIEKLNEQQVELFNGTNEDEAQIFEEEESCPENESKPNFDFADESQTASSDQIQQIYFMQKMNLLNEINELQNKLESEREKGKRRNDHLKSQIIALYKQNKEYRQQIRKFFENEEEEYEIEDSRLSTAFTDIARNIGISIKDLMEFV